MLSNQQLAEIRERAGKVVYRAPETLRQSDLDRADLLDHIKSLEAKLKEADLALKAALIWGNECRCKTPQVREILMDHMRETLKRIE